ncbi:bacterio-opsin activator domain-containing protein [Halomicrococcus gelatinilyticus]|uniref:bacterio-opsin activator domain-containing protein n=1 Tax=Halomicrococcus gelatinilyticus TaxID=1702103 RepID=UPI002E103FDF
MTEETVVLLLEHETAYAPELAGYDELDVLVADTAADARLRVERRGVDCVVCNDDLPDDDGLAVLDAVRKRRPGIPFVLLAVDGDEELASDAIAAGVTDYLPARTVDGPDALRDRILAVTERQATVDDRVRALTTAFPDVAFLIDEDGYYRELLVGPNAVPLVVEDQRDLIGKNVHDVFPAAKADRFLDHISETLASDGVETMEYPVDLAGNERWYEARTTALGQQIDGKDAVVWVARDVTDRRGRERRLERQHEELETLNRINQVIQDVLHGLVQAATREEIEQMVCDRLVDSDLYEVAWTAENEIRRDGLSPRARAGGVDGYLDALVDLGSDVVTDPATRAMDGDELQVIQDIDDTELLTERMKTLARERNVASGISIPLSYGNTIYGALSLVSTRTGVFSERAQSAFAILGETIGFAINAAKNRKLLLSDTAVELEFEMTGSQAVFVDACDTLDCSCRLRGLVPASEGQLLHYVRVDDAPASEVAAAVEERDQVEEQRVIGDDDDDSVIEVVMSASPIKRLVEAGAAVQTATTAEGQATIVAEVPQDADVRAIVDTFQAAYPDSELVGKRTVDRPIQTAQEFRRSLTQHLTERQETALRTAYFAGYYDWPRGSTAEEVAESLDITSATLHYHLRQAEQQLLAAVFAD